MSHRLPTALLLLRVTVFVVMIMWSIDKLIAHQHAAAVFANFYYIGNVGDELLVAIGLAQMGIEVAFLLGIARFWTYGFVLVTHAISTLATWKQYLDPFNNMLFLAGIPMLGACVALFLLRDEDRLLSLGR